MGSMVYSTRGKQHGGATARNVDENELKAITDEAFAAVASTPLGEDNAGNTITFKHVMGMQFEAPDALRAGIEEAKAGVRTQVSDYVQEVLDQGVNGRARSRADLAIGQKLKAYAQALDAAREHLPDICGDTSTTPPFIGMQRQALELASTMTRAIDTKVAERTAGAAAAR
jgi:hypothetical protein